MNETVKRIVDLLFDHTVDNEETRALHEEIMNNCQEHYADLVSRGLSEDEAVHEVVLSLKGMEEVVAEFRLPPETEDKASVPEEDGSLMEFSTDGVRRIRVETQMEDVVIRASQDGQFNFRYDGYKQTLDIVREGETLRVGLKKMEPVSSPTEEKNYTWRDVFPQHENGGFSFDLKAFWGKMQKHVNIGFGEEATLTVELPGGFDGALEVMSRSGNIDLSASDVTELNLNSTSGNVKAAVAPGVRPDRVTLNSTSGDITYYGGGNRLSVSVISGDVDLRGDFDTAAVKSVSGDIELQGSVGVSRFNTVSGDQTVSVAAGNNTDLRLESVSGDLDLTLAEDLTAKVTVNTTSGDTRILRATDPGADFKVWLKTVSGDIAVN